MSKIWTAFGIGVALMGLATSSFAQAAGPKGGATGLDQGVGKGQGQRLQALAKVNKEILAKLDLSKQQQRQVEAHQKKSQAAMQALREKAQGLKDRKGLVEELQKIQKESRDGMLKILTAEQQAKYKELLQAAIEKLRKDGGGVRDGVRPGVDKKGGTDKKGGKGGGGG